MFNLFCRITADDHDSCNNLESSNSKQKQLDQQTTNHVDKTVPSTISEIDEYRFGLKLS